MKVEKLIKALQDIPEIKKEVLAIKELLIEIKQSLKKAGDGNPYYTRTELMKFLNISSTTLHKRVKSGELIMTKVGRKVLFSKEMVEEYLNNNVVNIRQF